MNLGFSGRLTRATIQSPLTPLFLLAAIVFGFLALLTIPREEEPQISVPMIDIFVQANGLKATDAAELVTKPLEEIVKGIDGVEHVYSQTQDDRVLVTARFLTGTNADDAILRVQEKIRANYDKIPLGIPEPLIVGRGINDVAVVVLTLSPKPEAASRWNEKDLYSLAAKLQAELAKVGQCRPHLYSRRRRQRDQRRARSRAAGAVRRHAATAVDKNPRRQPLLPSGTTARKWSHAHGSPARHSRACRTSVCCWSLRVTDGRSMCAISPPSSSARARPSITSGRSGAWAIKLVDGASRQHRLRQAARRQCRGGSRAVDLSMSMRSRDASSQKTSALR